MTSDTSPDSKACARQGALAAERACVSLQRRAASAQASRAAAALGAAPCMQRQACASWAPLLHRQRRHAGNEERTPHRTCSCRSRAPSSSPRRIIATLASACGSPQL